LGTGQENAWAGFHGFEEHSNKQKTNQARRSLGIRLVGEKEIEVLEADNMDKNLLGKNSLYVVA